MSDTPLRTAQHIPHEFIIEEAARTNAGLSARMQAGGLGAQGNAVVSERMLANTERILLSPDRLAADLGKPANERTEYDIDRAHLAALAIDEAMTYIARDDRRRAARGREDKPFSAKRYRAEVAAVMNLLLANEAYDRDPIEAGPNMIIYEKQYRSRRVIRKPEF